MNIKYLLTTIYLFYFGCNHLIMAQVVDPTWKNYIPNYSFETVFDLYPYNPASGSNDYCFSSGQIGDYENWIKPYWEEIDRLKQQVQELLNK
ncbi:hypothetical protein GCM10009118_04820 [Wandonia haliotis]|uniref:Uncharacterized protein n=1 Tax=Wandonia haliotis TaxID=574963 RepID=A0ABN1MMF4_9FLAO